MAHTEEEALELAELFPDLQEATESGVTYYLIPDLELPPGCTPNRSDVLLCPSSRDGYPSRLYFAVQVVGGQPLNWNGQHFVLGRPWFAASWRTRAELRLAQMLSAHLDAVRPGRSR